MIAVWYAPILFKGYPAQAPEADSIILGRNFAQSSVLGIENKLNVVMAPDKLDQVQPTTLGNRFTAYSYSLIFGLLGWQGWDRLILISILLFALGAILFTITVYHLFGLRVAILFPLVYSLLPFNGQQVQYLGTYEFSLFYFALFTFFYFWGRDQKYRLVYLSLAGFFLALAGLSREAMFVFLPIFFFWRLFAQTKYKDLSAPDNWRQKIWPWRKLYFLWLVVVAGFKRNKKELLTVFVPVALMLAIFWLPSFIGIGGSNDYLKLFISTDKTENNWSEFHYYSHIYPDPYTYHFDAESVKEQLQKDISNKNGSFLYVIDRLKIGKNMGVMSLGILGYLAVGAGNLLAHISKFFAIEFIGGPLIFLLMLLGFWQLKKLHSELANFFIFWIAATILLLSFFVLASRSHLMDFGWALAVVVSVGLVGCEALIGRYYQAGKYTKLAYVFVVAVTLYSFVLADHVYWGRSYDNNSNLSVSYIAQKINDRGNEISGNDIIAVGNGNLHPWLNYLTGKSVVYFDQATITKLIKEQKLQWAFDQFGVKYIAGFSADLSSQIVVNSKAADLVDWPKDEEIKSQVSFNKMWFLNIVK